MMWIFKNQMWNSTNSFRVSFHVRFWMRAYRCVCWVHCSVYSLNKVKLMWQQPQRNKTVTCKPQTAMINHCKLANCFMMPAWKPLWSRMCVYVLVIQPVWVMKLLHFATKEECVACMGITVRECFWGNAARFSPGVLQKIKKAKLTHFVTFVTRNQILPKRISFMRLQ